MNKEYIYVNGKVVVADESGIKPPIDYSDNIEDILVTENVIEEIEKTLKEKQSNLESNQLYEKSLKKNKMLPILIFAIGSVVIPSILVPSLGTNELVETIFGVTMHTSTLLTINMIPLLTLIGGLLSGILHFEHKTLVHEIKGNRSEIYFLSQKLEEEKEKLNQLQNKRTRKNEKEFNETSSSKIVKDRKQLEELKELLNIYYNYGVNTKKYLKYQEKGILKEKLAQENYTEYEIGLVENYLNGINEQQSIEEKEKTRILKK